jgi:hypothetical protein
MNMELWIVSLILIVFGDLIQPWTLWQSKTASFDPGSMSVRQAHAPAPVIIHTGMQNGENNADIKKAARQGSLFWNLIFSGPLEPGSQSVRRVACSSRPTSQEAGFLRSNSVLVPSFQCSQGEDSGTQQI